ncbi:hypothetical protein BpJC7_22670 [Weizmannia acidilactici]|uniref:Uncharacterized protein n=1 Tax=Weizmannia acidilactici TaxID=2607726 RepID=A0A5J4JPK3_9BACI|nr:hypothetical protein [Weizmannia acidilactici]GER68579.1 hypothetical protein BpJC4_30500 [Weizmannia acidilactici]GER70964.1 hypothetical protein BpJC7_22670 [Weizmannia acidilactici]GER75159.1 hypothetical protein BpPP18_32260 [Weizmannia acidilactici]
MHIEGNIISGEFDENLNEFSLQNVKHFYIASTIRENQFRALYDYLKKHQHNNEGQIITLYDQMPVSLSAEEINLLIQDLEKVQSLYRPENI